MGKKKIAFQVTIDILASSVNTLIKDAEEHMMDDHGLKLKLKDNAEFLALVEKGIKKNIGYAADDFYFYDVVDTSDLDKLFKAEIKVAEDKYLAEQKAEQAKREAERAKTAGVLRMSTTDLSKALKLLKEAGIVATT